MRNKNLPLTSEDVVRAGKGLTVQYHSHSTEAYIFLSFLFFLLFSPFLYTAGSAQNGCMEQAALNIHGLSHVLVSVAGRIGRARVSRCLRKTAGCRQIDQSRCFIETPFLCDHTVGLVCTGEWA